MRYHCLHIAPDILPQEEASAYVIRHERCSTFDGGGGSAYTCETMAVLVKPFPAFSPHYDSHLDSRSAKTSVAEIVVRTSAVG